MSKKLRALVIGRGSMGKRRIRDLTTLGVEVESWDLMDNVDIPRGPFDVFVVSTPPDQHQVHGFGPHFIEAGVQQVGMDSKTFPLYASATPLFTDWYAKLSEDADVQYAHNYILHVGQHIDDWHPGADRTTYYAYRDETSPTREMIPFELIWLSKIYGPVLSASGHRSPELAVIRVEHERGIGKIIIDAVSRPAIRTFEVFGLSDRQWMLGYEEKHYLAEMRAFVAAVKGEAPWPYSQSEEAANLEVLHMIER